MKPTDKAKDFVRHDWERVWKNPPGQTPTNRFKAYRRAHAAETGRIDIHLTRMRTGANPRVTGPVRVTDQDTFDIHMPTRLYHTKQTPLVMDLCQDNLARNTDLAEALASLRDEIADRTELRLDYDPNELVNQDDLWDVRATLYNDYRLPTRFSLTRTIRIPVYTTRYDRLRQELDDNALFDLGRRIHREDAIAAELPVAVERRFRDMNNSNLCYRPARKDPRDTTLERHRAAVRNKPWLADTVDTVNHLNRTGVPLNRINELDVDLDSDDRNLSDRRETVCPWW